MSKGGSIDSATPDGTVAIPQFWSKGVEYVFLSSSNGEKVELNKRLDLDMERREQNLNGWSHIGIPVTDIARTETFYERFGFEKIMRAAIHVDREEIKVSMLELQGFILEFYHLLPSCL